MSKQFKDLSMKAELINNVRELGYVEMTPIQEKSLPIVLAGKDIIAQAKTGSGKTAAFGLGILNQLDISITHPQSLILCPTRELAEQVAKDMRSLARMLPNVKVLTICGGTAEYHQERSLAYGAHIIVGTPGRVLRLLKKSLIDLREIKSFVLDEADRMLDMGFYDDIKHISVFAPKAGDRQSMLFSATFPEEIEELSYKILKDPEMVTVDTLHEENTITQCAFELDSHKDKNAALLKVLATYKPERSIVFCKTKVIVDKISDFLNRNGVVADGIHGDHEQNERTLVMSKFSNKSLSVLVATDVAARGLDIKELPAVINYDLPQDLDDYIHRIGRTGRAGLSGMAFSFYVEQEGYKLDDIEDLINTRITSKNISELSEDDKYDLTPAMTTMYIGGGKKDKLRPGDILGALVGEAKIESKDVGNITILNILSYVAIKTEYIDHVIDKLQNGKIKNKKFKVGLA